MAKVELFGILATHPGIAFMVGSEIDVAVLDEIGTVALLNHVFLKVHAVFVHETEQPPKVVPVLLPAFLEGLRARKFEGDRATCWQ
jgi:hypothetical protein